MALSSVLGAISIDTESTRKLKSFVQQNTAETDNEMGAKAEGELSDLRKKEMANAHEFKMLESSLTAEIDHAQEKLATATKTKASAQESEATAEGDLAETTKTKAADEEYSANSKTECELAAKEWAARQASAKEEMAAIEKAKEILVSGVVALVQSGTKLTKKSDFDDDDSESDAASETR